ncbi:MAG: acyl-CoA thioesterase [Candidatus Omnitrophica bacterium]|nr:acyl-CoA thioesterase [Candidatus Omnitrophota bacterium]
MNYFDYEYRVLYADTDKLGISYYANYLIWFEAARTEYFRALGILYSDCEKRGYFLPVTECRISYLSPTTYDDLLVIRASVSEMGRSSLCFEYQVFKKDGTLSEKDRKGGTAPRLIATGFTRHVFVDQDMHPVRVPDEIRRLVTPYKLSVGKREEARSKTAGSS